MTPEEAFKIGFLSKCASLGLSPEETQGLAKTAFDLLEKQSGNGLVDAFKSVGYPAAALALAAPPAIGGLAAYFKNKATDIDDEDIESVKRQELISQYKRMSDKLERENALRKRNAGQKRTSQVFL